MKRKTAQEWSDLVRRWQRSGETAKAFGARAGVSAGQLSWWRWHLKRGPKTKSSAVASSRALVKAPSSPVLEFLPVRLPDPTTVCEVPCGHEPTRARDRAHEWPRGARPGCSEARQRPLAPVTGL